MPFENESILKSYIDKMNSQKNAADILFKKTVDILLPQVGEPAKSTLQHIDIKIRDRISIQDKRDLFAVLSKINLETLQAYFIKLEELFKQSDINADIVVQFMSDVLKNEAHSKILAFAHAPEALLVLTKKMLKQLPTMQNVPMTMDMNETNLAILRLAKSVYSINANCYKDFSEKLVAAARRNEISYFQLIQFIEILLDVEFKEKYKEGDNAYLRMNNIITNMIVTIIPPEDRARFIWIIRRPILDFLKAITLIQLERSTRSLPKCTLDAERLEIMNAKPPVEDKKFPKAIQHDEIYEFISTAALDLQEVIKIWGEAPSKDIPPFIRLICKILANSLFKNLPNNSAKNEKIIVQIASFITNKLCGSLFLDWIKKTYSGDDEYANFFNQLIIKPLQKLVTSQNTDNLPKCLAPLMNKENQSKILSLSQRIINEDPNFVQEFFTTHHEYQAVLNTLPQEPIAAGAPPISGVQMSFVARSNIHAESENPNLGSKSPPGLTTVSLAPVTYTPLANEIEVDPSSSDDEEEVKSIPSVPQPTTAAPMISSREALAKKQIPPLPPIGNAQSAQNNTLRVVPANQLLQFDPKLDENEVEIRLIIIFEQCLALAKQLNIDEELPSQKTLSKSLFPKKIHSLFPAAPAATVLPKKAVISQDLIYVAFKLAQNDSAEKDRLVKLYKELDEAVCSYEGYKSYHVTITKAGLDGEEPKPRVGSLVIVPLQ